MPDIINRLVVSSDTSQLVSTNVLPAVAEPVRMAQVGERLGKRVRELRKQLSCTQEELAHRASISVSFLSMVERGERLPRLETLATLAEALGVSISELFTGVSEPGNGSAQILRPLITFLSGQPLSSEDLEKLLIVAKALFKPK
jgi:transcriptional regulator with XRE-family HTH domain